ncbi:MAG: hypothetical protein MI725_14690 [Pirellulales bacterium]|nr:hypothetical protein [Pirellulales bacterium]
MKHNVLGLVTFVAASAVFAQVASAAGFNVDFGDDFTGLPSTYGAASGQTGTWNDVSANGTLQDITGTATTVSVTLIVGNPSGQINSATTNDEILLGDNFFFSSGWNVDFANLPDGLYDVYYYAPSNGAVSTGVFTINGATQTELPGDPGSSLSLGTSYDFLSGVSVVGGTLSLASTGGVLESNFGLAGLQLIPVPEPASFILFAVGCVAAPRMRRRR